MDMKDSSMNEPGPADSKSLFASRTFWFNVATMVVTFAGILPTKYAAPIAAVGNILLRIITDQPVHILPEGK